MTGKEVRRGFLALILGMWAVSLCLPAESVLTFGGPKTYRGGEAALSSMVLFFVPFYGQVWMPNVLMIAAPFLLKRLENGRDTHFRWRFYLCFLWDICFFRKLDSWRIFKESKWDFTCGRYLCWPWPLWLCKSP
jgi:uncharacterized membrane protein YcfT